MIKKKVAIFQNTITGGGRIRVVEEIIRILNKMGIIPDLYTFRVNPSYRPDPSLNFQIRKVYLRIRGLSELKMPLLNLNMHIFANKYELFINSNNSLLLVPQTIPTIAYIHFPREARILTQYAELAFPDGKRVSEMPLYFRIYRSILKLIYSFRSLPRNHIIITNSKFTKNMFLDAYPVMDASKIKVVYPPNDIEHWKNQILKTGNSVVTLGRFGKDKRQLEQIQIAEMLPELKFNIIGFVGDKHSENYFNACRNYVSSHEIKNVLFYPNSELNETKRMLHTASFFMHNLRNEPFGISTVEAIAAGCIPIVHDSGGQKEIVPFDGLRFNDKIEAVKKIKNLRNRNTDKKLRALQSRLRQFDKSEFYNKIKQYLKLMLSPERNL